MKILHFVGSMKRAGIETFVMNMMREINPSQCHFDFLCKSRESGDYDEEILRSGSRIYYVDYNKKGGKLFNYIELKKVLTPLSQEYDAIHIHHYHAFDVLVSAKAAIAANFKNVVVHSHSASVPSQSFL